MHSIEGLWMEEAHKLTADLINQSIPFEVSFDESSNVSTKVSVKSSDFRFMPFLEAFCPYIAEENIQDAKAD